MTDLEEAPCKSRLVMSIWLKREREHLSDHKMGRSTGMPPVMCFHLPPTCSTLSHGSFYFYLPLVSCILGWESPSHQCRTRSHRTWHLDLEQMNTDFQSELQGTPLPEDWVLPSAVTRHSEGFFSVNTIVCKQSEFRQIHSKSFCEFPSPAARYFLKKERRKQRETTENCL